MGRRWVARSAPAPIHRLALLIAALSTGCGGSGSSQGGDGLGSDGAGQGADADGQAAPGDGGSALDAGLQGSDAPFDAMSYAPGDAPGVLPALEAGCPSDEGCPPGALCAEGTCVPGCTPAHPCADGGTCCSGLCSDLATDALHCGACDKACSPENVTPACAAGLCTGVCATGFADCNQDLLTDGCETAIATDVHNCGACGSACSTSNVTAACAGGICDGPCAAGWADCNANLLTDGCETNTRTTTADCGGCGQSCSTSHVPVPACAAGVCSGACQSGWVDCNHNELSDGCETNVATDVRNCGGCGASCSTNHVPTPACAGGVCDGSCQSGWADCNHNEQTDGCETHTSMDPANCGSCGAACANTCSAGKCVCRVGLPGAPVLAVGAQPESIAAADFDGDGRIDLVVANSQAATTGGYSVDVFLNQGGAYFSRTAYAVDPGPMSVVAGDLNGDGKPDLAVAAYNSQAVDVLLNDGTGHFGSSTKYIIANNPVDLALVGPAGTPNIVVVDEYGSDLKTMGNNGNGTFSASALGTGTATGNSPEAIAVGDVDGDGTTDMAVANCGDSTVSVFLRGGRTDYATGTCPLAVALADVNGDGKLDLLASDGGSYGVRVFINQGSGTFGTGVSYSTSGRVMHIAVADLDEDGHPDIATSCDFLGYPLNILLNKGDGTFGTATGHASSNAPPWGTSIVAADLRGRGHRDLALVQYAAQTVYLYVNEGKGVFAIAPVVATGAAPMALASGDLNGDGKPDLVSANYDGDSVSVILNTGARSFAANVDYSAGVGSQPTAVALGDLNGDGRLDVVSANEGGGSIGVFLSTVGDAGADAGGGTLAAAVTYPCGSGLTPNPDGVAIGDLNGDHALDVVVVTNSDNKANLFFNDGHGAFPTVTTVSTGSAPTAVTIADFNGDGALDLAVADGSDANVTVLTNQGKGTFGTGATYGTGGAPQAVAAGDLNGDGLPDLVTVDGSSNTVSVLLNQGSAVFATKVSYPLTQLPGSLTLADVDGDGHLDVVAASQNDTSGVTSVFLNTGNGALAPRLDFSTPSGTQAVAAADLDGDGRMDVAAAIDYNGGGAAAYLMWGGCL